MAVTHTMPMQKASDLSKHFLIAMPSLEDSIFSKSVVYLHEHAKSGAMGLIINKPMQLTVGNVLNHLDIEVTADDIGTLPILMGGPMGQENGFVLYNNDKEKSPGISASKEILRNIAKGKGPKNFIITLGYSSWTEGQLENEIGRNDWLIVPAHNDIIFETPAKARWQTAANLLGVDITRLTDQVGHA